jgi:UDP:flavonoid glycosyltransferase YjiC (YdhE family)
MRVLLTSQPGEGHWRPLAPLARALSEAGHNVAFATTLRNSAIIRSHGFTCFPAGDDDDGGVERTDTSTASPDPHDPAPDVWRYVFAGRRVERMLPAMLEIGRRWRPDLVVREISEFSGWLMAERLGIPHAALQVSAWRSEPHEVIADALNAHRTRIGLDRELESSTLYRFLLLSPIPPAYRKSGHPFPETTLSKRFEGFDRRPDDQRPVWLDELGARPVVYATLGTAYNQHPKLFALLLDAIRDVPVDLILTTGLEELVEGLGRQTDNVRIASYIPQSWLLPHCDLVVSHGGFGTVQAALQYGLPLVLLPIAADQPDNARFCRAHGLAEVVEPYERSVDAIQSAVRTVLEDHGYRERAQSWQRAARALPSSAEVVSLLERLAEERRSSAAG